MSTLQKSIDFWNSADLDAFVSQRAEESLILEFKRELGLRNERDKKEAAKDICAMANTAGGWIIYGIDEERSNGGAPVAAQVVPFDTGNLPAQLENIALAAIAPAPSIRIKRIDCNSGACVAVRVEPSRAHVHQVVAYNDFRFYRRTDFSARPMSEAELRDAFGRVAAMSTQAASRFSELVAAATAEPCEPQFIIALIPASSHEVLDPGVVLNSDATWNSLDHHWRGTLRSAASGAVGRLGKSYWLHIGRDATFALTHPIENRELPPNHVLFELFELQKLARALCGEFNVHSSWHLAFALAVPSAIQLHMEFPRQPTAKVKSAQFLLSVSHSELLTDWEPPAARAMRRLYQVFGLDGCPLFSSQDRIISPEIRLKLRLPEAG